MNFIGKDWAFVFGWAVFSLAAGIFLAAAVGAVTHPQPAPRCAPVRVVA